MDKLKIDLQERSYNIYFNNSYKTLADNIKRVCRGKKILIVTDSNVESLYLKEVSDLLTASGFEVYTFVFSAGEKQKNINVLCDIYKSAIQYGLDRKGIIAALGGGVAGDISGFAAASYMRGIDFIQIPTTLLAQVDSSVGGKVAIDFGGVKNIVGAFYQPKMVYINTSVLKTLDIREYRAGMGEVIKYGVIYDKAFLDRLYENSEKIIGQDKEELTEIIAQCCEIKAKVVALDETEQGLRAILNFGHTIGHGIESAMDFKLLHGECVALGMIAACHIAKKRGLISEQEENLVYNVICSYGFKCSITGADMSLIKDYIKKDKKQDLGVLKFILPIKLGKVSAFTDVSEAEIEAALKYLGVDL